MNPKNLMLGVFTQLTVVLASVTASEYAQINGLNSQIQSGQSKSTSPQVLTTTTTITSDTIIVHTFTALTNTTSTSATCTNTGLDGIGCPHSFNETFTISVSYEGPWGVTYQGYLGVSGPGLLVESASFYGHGPASESVTVGGRNTDGITLCAEAQKLDASNSTLVLRFLSPGAGNVMNQTSLAYGTTKTCVGVFGGG